MPRAGKKLSPDAAMPAISEDAKENFPPNEEDTVVNQEISSEDVTEKVPEETTTVPDETASKRSASFGSRSSQQMIKKRRTMSNRAGLTFPVYRILKHLKKGRYAKIIQKGAAVYLAAGLEYLVAEVAELGCEAAIANRKMRITPRHLVLCLRQDEEFRKLLQNVTISQGGVLPFIQPLLLPQRSKD